MARIGHHTFELRAHNNVRRNILSTETGAVTQHSLYLDLFNQNGMDFVTEIFFCKHHRQIIYLSLLKLRRRTHYHNL